MPPGAAPEAALAARWLLAGRRLEMQGLADELGVARVTLHRRTGGREPLLAEALWLLTEGTLRRAEQRWDAERPPGALSAPGVARHLNALVAASPVLRTLLDSEPALAIRVLTDPRGKVQTGVVRHVEALLRRDVEHGWVPLIEPAEMAYALVRLGESFLYADVLAARRPDVETADRLQQALLSAGRPGAPRTTVDAAAHR